jgi:hypothetical protein
LVTTLIPGNNRSWNPPCWPSSEMSCSQPPWSLDWNWDPPASVSQMLAGITGTLCHSQLRTSFLFGKHYLLV